MSFLKGIAAFIGKNKKPFPMRKKIATKQSLVETNLPKSAVTVAFCKNRPLFINHLQKQLAAQISQDSGLAEIVWQKWL